MKHLQKRKLVKVRTGCITCKIRKVKCDEGKPVCQRCTDTGRKCDGYAGPDEAPQDDRQRLIPTSRESWVIPPNDVLLYADSDSLSHNICAEQRQWLQYFSLQVGPVLSGLADREFWTTKLPQLSLHEPSIRHAMLAVGSLYSSLERSTNSHSAINEDAYRFSVKQYNLSIASLRPELNGESAKLHLPLTCCLLYICLECLYGDRSLVLGHLRNGLNMFSSPAFKCIQSNFITSIKPHLEQILRRLDAQSTLFGEPASLLFGVPSTETISTVPTTFRDVFEAQNSLDTLISLSLNFVRYHHDRAVTGKPHTDSARSTLNQLRVRYKAWEHGIDQLVATSTLHDNDLQNSVTRLRIQYYASLIYVSNCLDIRECSYDAFHKEFGNIVRLAGTLSGAPSNSTTSSPSSHLASLSVATSSSSIFALDASVIPSLYLAALKCREPTIRREAIRLLDSTPGREGLWDAKLHGRVARRVMVIEESAMAISQNATVAATKENYSPLRPHAQDVIPSHLPEERCRVQSADIHQKPVGGLRTATINFLTAPEGTDQPWVTWSEEIDF